MPTDAESPDHPQQCPLCEEEFVGFIEPGTSHRTPSNVDDQWRICVTEAGVYVHAIGFNDWEDYDF